MSFRRNFMPPFFREICAGLTIALFLFIINDLVIVPRPLNGLWYCEMRVVETHYSPYTDLETGNIMVLYSDRSGSISGSFERVWENHPKTGEKLYRDEEIMYGLLRGYQETRILFRHRRARLQIHTALEGEIRTPSYLFDLRAARSGTVLEGTFLSTVALYEYGNVECRRHDEVGNRIEDTWYY